MGRMPGWSVSAVGSASSSARVRVARCGQDELARRMLDDPPGVEDGNPLGQRRHHGEVVRDQDDRQPCLAQKPVEQPQDPGLHRDVEGCGRLIGNENLGASRQRGGDRDALAHSSGELVRIGAQRPLGVRNAHVVEQLDGAPAGSGTRQPLVVTDVLGDLTADRQHRMQRGHRALEDHRHATSAQIPHPLFGQADQLDVSQPCGAADRAPARSSPSSASPVIVLPLPLSPAMPRTSPASTEKLAPETTALAFAVQTSAGLTARRHESGAGGLRRWRR